MKQIKSLKELKRLSSGKGIEAKILLNLSLSSKKFIRWDKKKKKWYIINYIDDTTTSNLADTNIEKAIEKHALVID